MVRLGFLLKSCVFAAHAFLIPEHRTSQAFLFWFYLFSRGQPALGIFQLFFPPCYLPFTHASVAPVLLDLEGSSFSPAETNRCRYSILFYFSLFPFSVVGDLKQNRTVRPPFFSPSAVALPQLPIRAESLLIRVRPRPSLPEWAQSPI